ncbi:MAG TPA: DNA-directed RNA polymerase [Bacillota bacterium]|nr:DNA-directed RNA polymerase [Bacillota bacterium]
MFYLSEIQDYVRVEPKLFGLPTMEAVEQQLKEIYTNYYEKEIGKVIAVLDVLEVGDGIIIPGDGAAYYNTRFKLLVWKPEMHELVYGIVSEITNFGAFINLGVLRGMIHISQTMEDYVSFSKTNTLIGKSTKRSLKEGDLCLARIVAISHKGDEPKLALTMRQPGLGKTEWIKENQLKKERDAKRAMRGEKFEKSTKQFGKGNKQKGGKKK